MFWNLVLELNVGVAHPEEPGKAACVGPLKIHSRKELPVLPKAGLDQQPWEEEVRTFQFADEA